jgi:hypothetical protein
MKIPDDPMEALANDVPARVVRATRRDGKDLLRLRHERASLTELP